MVSFEIDSDWENKSHQNTCYTPLEIEELTKIRDTISQRAAKEDNEDSCHQGFQFWKGSNGRIGQVVIPGYRIQDLEGRCYHEAIGT